MLVPRPKLVPVAAAVEPRLDPVEDAQVLERIRLERDPEALLALYRRYGGRVLALALRITGDRAAAEEVVQDVFCRLWDRSHLYDAGKGAFLSWLLTLTRNLALDSRRRESRRATLLVSMDMTAESIRVSSRDHLERRQAIRSSLASLPESQRTVVEMLYFEGLTNAELAARLGEPLGTIKTRARLALEKLRGLFASP